MQKQDAAKAQAGAPVISEAALIALGIALALAAVAVIVWREGEA